MLIIGKYSIRGDFSDYIFAYHFVWKSASLKFKHVNSHKVFCCSFGVGFLMGF